MCMSASELQHLTHLLSSNGCRAVRFEQTAKFSLLRLLMIRGLLSKHSFRKSKEIRKSQSDCCKIKTKIKKKRSRDSLWSDLTEEHEHAHVELQQPGDAERPSLCAAQWIKQQLSAQRSFPLLSPHIDLLLAVSERTVLSVLTLLSLLYLCRTRGETMSKKVKQTSLYSAIISCCWMHFRTEYSTYSVHLTIFFIRVHTFTEYKRPQEVVSCRSRPDPLPRGVICVFDAAQQHVPLTAVCCLWLILVVHHSWTYEKKGFKI